MKSKTYAGLGLVLLGTLGILLDASEFIALPTLANQIIQIVGFIIASMGIRDSMLQSKAGIIKKLVDIHSKTFWGALIQGFVYIMDNMDKLPVPDKYVPIIQVFAAIFQAIGWRNAAIRSRG